MGPQPQPKPPFPSSMLVQSSIGINSNRRVNQKRKLVEMREEEQALIPGLPEDVAVDCISRVPHLFHSQIRPVCKEWRDLVTAPSFLRHRERIGAAEDLVFLVQALKDEGKEKEIIRSVDPVTAGEVKAEVTAANSRPPVYSLGLYNATAATWHRIAVPEAIPMFSQCAVVDNKLVLLGGWDPVTLDPVADTRILDLMTMKWRRGRPMATARSFFACAAVGGKVYVAGGHDGQKNALRSAEAYDVASDEWVSLPPMSEERDEARGLSIGRKFWAVSGYSTENQGRFATSAECYDPDKREWTKMEAVWDDATCASCFGFAETMCTVDSRGVREYNGRDWERVGPAPEEMKSSTCAVAIGNGDRAFITGGEDNGGWVMDLKTRKWIRRVKPPIGFSGFVYSAAAVRI